MSHFNIIHVNTTKQVRYSLFMDKRFSGCEDRFLLISANTTVSPTHTTGIN